MNPERVSPPPEAPAFCGPTRPHAAHFASTDPEPVLFGIMEEPQDDTYHRQGIHNEVAVRFASRRPSTPSSQPAIDRLVSRIPTKTNERPQLNINKKGDICKKL
jgi:hypothetical protein